MNNDNSTKLDSNLTATEKFAIDSMAKKIQEDWDIFTKEAQKELDTSYERIAREGKEHEDEGFIQQSVERIKEIKRSVSEARRTKIDRLDDLDRVARMIGGKN